jgi:hypothetical protein
MTMLTRIAPGTVHGGVAQGITRRKARRLLEAPNLLDYLSRAVCVTRALRTFKFALESRDVLAL